MKIRVVAKSYNPLRKLNDLILEELDKSLYESKRTEQEAAKVLQTNYAVDKEDILATIEKFKEIDQTKDKRLLAPIATAYSLNPNNMHDIYDVFGQLSMLINKGTIQQNITTDGKQIFNIGDKSFNGWLPFAEHVHGIAQMEAGEKYIKDIEKINVEGEDVIWENDKFAIYDGRDVGKCIKYGEGSISGRGYRFCIGQRGSGMHQSYRDTQVSTFYYIFDKQRSLDDPLHMVVFDNVDPEFAKLNNQKIPVILTDANNTTGNIAQFGNDAAAYVEYLKKNNVPVEKMMHVPHTEEEKIAAKLLKDPNPDLEWFKTLGKQAKEMGLATDMDIHQLTYKLMSNYIGRGHILSDQQWKYLWDLRQKKAAKRLLAQYVNIGRALPEEQFNDMMGIKTQDDG
jgi:hypothetical protein